ncbi:geranylgeranyl reductase family protein [Leptolyngbya sp. FACHB-36]|uniref:geranylgeranyl reductase family protein n=1 Tax=Leptolyngbya sp. FACHB-36 TaxID=2692808 RepID=UPI001681119B|nr:geranylgeranyl reductase family protein [Leptolyngbya sp. FACHB-36]
MANYDLIVCGAGPAGAVAAATAAQAGLHVALLEKHTLPRHKTCGGGTPMVMQNLVRDLVPDAIVESDVLLMRHTWNFAEPHLAPINVSETDRKLSIWMMQRSVFDNALAQRAAHAGAKLLDGVAVRSVELEGDRVRVRASTKERELTATARYVIGADGANSVTAHVLKRRRPPTIALGMEVEHPHTWGSGHSDLRPEIAHLEYGAVKYGYAWVFPKADHLNIGAGVFRPQYGDARRDRAARGELQQAIFGYLNALHLKYNPDTIRFHAHPLPVWSGKEQLHSPDGRVLLAGDAARLINPLFGDGILHAVKSGAIAATCVAEGTTQRYSDRIHAEFAANFDAALRLAQLFYRYPSLCYKYGVNHPRGTRLATQLLAGELSFTHMFSRALRRLQSGLLGHSASAR